MTRRIYWGLAILIALLIGVSVVMLTRTTDTEITVYTDVDPSKRGQPSTKKLAETDKFNKWFKDNKATLVSDNSEQVKGNMPAEQEANKFPDWGSLTPEQRQHIYNQFYTQMGLDPPPPGYEYRWKDRWVPLLDENGNPVLHKKDEPIIEVHMGIGFAPTLEEFKKYNKLLDDQGWAESRGDVAEVARLEAEITALEASVQRIRPVNVTTITSNAKAQSKSRSMAKEAKNAALREHGLAHLITPW